MEGTARNRGWGRNWKWIVPVGFVCLVLLLSGAVIAFFVLVFGHVRSSEVYVEAMSEARSDAEVSEAIGKPIEDGLFPSGSFYTSGASGYAEIAIPISGPKGSATVYGAAEKSLGDWTFTDLVVEADEDDESGRRINLRDGNNPETDPETEDQART